MSRRNQRNLQKAKQKREKLFRQCTGATKVVMGKRALRTKKNCREDGSRGRRTGIEPGKPVACQSGQVKKIEKGKKKQNILVSKNGANPPQA